MKVTSGPHAGPSDVMRKVQREKQVAKNGQY